MSRENEAIVRLRMETLDRARPHEVAEGVAETWEAEGDYYPVRKFPGARPCHGREEIARFFADYLEVWSIEHRLSDVIAVGDDRVLVCATLRTRGLGSEMELEGDIFHVVWLRHGRFMRQEDHLTLRAAIHALGLEGDTLEDAGLVT